MTLAQSVARTARPERSVRWKAVDAQLASGARALIAKREGRSQGANPGTVILLIIAWLGPVAGFAMLLGTWAGRFEAAISVPAAAIGCAIGAIVDGFLYRHERRHPQGAMQLYSWMLPVAATLAIALATLRSIDEQLAPTVAVPSLIVIVAAAVLLWVLLARRFRLPRTQQEDRTQELQRNPAAEAAMRDDLAATVAIYLERGLISAELAQRAIDLGPGRLAELDR